MGESLTERRRVEDEGPRVVNSCHMLRKVRVHSHSDEGMRGSHG